MEGIGDVIAYNVGRLVPGILFIAIVIWIVHKFTKKK
jgi:flagellar biogenesis protein FliO